MDNKENTFGEEEGECSGQGCFLRLSYLEHVVRCVYCHIPYCCKECKDGHWKQEHYEKCPRNM